MTAVLTAISTSKKEGAQLVTVPIWAIIVTQRLASASVHRIPLERNVLNVHLTPGATVLSLDVRRVIAVLWDLWISNAIETQVNVTVIQNSLVLNVQSADEVTGTTLIVFLVIASCLGLIAQPVIQRPKNATVAIRLGNALVR